MNISIFVYINAATYTFMQFKTLFWYFRAEQTSTVYYPQICLFLYSNRGI